MDTSTDDDQSVPYFFPDDHPIRHTLQVFPQSASVKNAAGAPWACCVSPFLDFESLYGDEATVPSPIPIDQIARCEECFAYVSPFSDFSQRHWKCALCGHQSRFTPELSRYRKSNAFDVLPELSQETVEYELPLDSKGAMLHSGEVMLEAGYLAKEPAAARPVVYIAVVDEGGSREYHEAMAEILDACVKTLPDDSRFGVVTVSDRVGLVNLSASLPHIQFVDLGLRSDHGDGGAAGGGGGRGAGTQLPRDSWPDTSRTVALSDVMSLEELLCPLQGNRDRVSANVRGLHRACRCDTTATAGINTKGPVRAVGLAVKLMLDLILRGGANATETTAASIQDYGNHDGAAAAAFQRRRRGGARAAGQMPSAVERTRGFQIAGGRLLLFLGGAPNRGPGAVGQIPPGVDWGETGGEEQDGLLHDQLFRGESRALGFYRGQAYRAASCGVSVDVHCLANKTCDHFGLSSISPLAMTTGGGIFRHSLLHQQVGEKRAVALAREVQHDLLRPRVYDGLLRIRTSAEFSVNRDGVYGNLSADSRLDDLWHVVSCASGQTFSMDFEFRSSGIVGLEVEDGDVNSTVQSAFAYTAVVPDTAGDPHSASINNDNDASSTHTRMVTVRRLRVSTCRTEASSRVAVVAEMSDPAPVASVLAHKVVSEARRSGFVEARALLRDWLANFVYGLARNLEHTDSGDGQGADFPASPRGEVEDGGSRDVGRELLTHPLVVGMARLVFGLLHSPLLHPTRGVPDARVSLLSRISSLDPESLSIALYPEMQGYATPDVRVANNLPLSREAVKSACSTCRIFVIDTFSNVIVHYVDTPETMAAGMAAGESPLRFPPSDDSAIGAFLAMRQRIRPMAGQEVIYSRPDTPEAFFFEDAMLEDRPLPNAEKGQTFSDFFSELMRDAMQE